MSLAPHDCSAWVLNAKQRREVFWLFDTYLFEEVDKRVQQIGVHEALSHFKISLRLLVQSRHTKKFDDTFFMTHESTREMRSMPARPMWLWAVSATPHLVHDVPVTACFWRQVNHSSREKRCSYMIQFLWEMAVFLFVCNIFLCNLHHHPPTHPSILHLGDSEEPALSAGVISWEPSSKAAAWFPWKQPTSGEKIGGGMCYNAAGYHGDWSDSLHKYSLCVCCAEPHSSI